MVSCLGSFLLCPDLWEGNGIKRRSINSEFGKKGRGWSGCWRKRGGGREAAVPALLVITLDLLVMLMSCWVIAHVYQAGTQRGQAH